MPLAWHERRAPVPGALSPATGRPVLVFLACGVEEKGYWVVQASSLATTIAVNRKNEQEGHCDS